MSKLSWDMRKKCCWRNAVFGRGAVEVVEQQSGGIHMALGMTDAVVYGICWNKWGCRQERWELHRLPVWR